MSTRLRLGAWVATAAALLLTAATARAAVNTATNSGNWEAPGTWSAGVPQPSHDVVIPTNITVTINGLDTKTINSLSITGVLEHAANAATEANKIHLSISNNLTIAVGGAINVSEKGYAAGSGPGVGGQGTGGTHGGQGGELLWGTSTGFPGATYGSITNPVTSGSGGRPFGSFSPGGRGGGIIHLDVGGVLTLNGLIVADGQTATGGGGGGGSVNLTADTLTGAGTISANGGATTSGHATGGSGGGGGGRIAVKLNLGAWSQFSGLTISAYGGQAPRTASNGAAGTIYLRETIASHGRLDVANANRTSNSRTLISSNVTDTITGGVRIRDGAHLLLDTNQTLHVYGSWSNLASFTAEPESTVKIGGEALATNSISGNSRFARFECRVPGLTLEFEAGSTNVAYERIILTGANESNVVLRSSDDGVQWYLNVMDSVSSADKTFDFLDVKDSNADVGTTLVAINSVNSLNNSNWAFTVTGLINVWTGTADAQWYNADNWSLERPPELMDAKVTIPDGCPNYPFLSGPIAVNELEIAAGATLWTSNQTLTVNHEACLGGALIASGTETLTFVTHVVFSDSSTFNSAQSIVALTGTGPQSLTPGGAAFYRLQILNTNSLTIVNRFSARDLILPTPRADVVFGSGFSVSNLIAAVSNGATLTFTSGEQYTVQHNLWVRGATDHHVVLTATGAWNLNAARFHSVRFARIHNSDASFGRTLYAVESIDDGNNPNWNFATGKIWIGPDVPWNNAANWSPAGVPDGNSHVVIDGTVAAIPRITAATTIAGLSVIDNGGPATLLVDMSYAGADQLTVTGDANVGDGGTISHSANSGDYRLSMRVNGNLVVDADGAINVSCKGFAARSGTGVGGQGTGGTHGGQGGELLWGAASGFPGPTYGLIANPLTLGSGGQTYGSLTPGGRGGGIIHLDVAGLLTLNGLIVADGETVYGGGGAGGSVNITTDTLTGTGTISANGGASTSGGATQSAGGGGGGRIAVNLNSGAWSQFSGLTISAFGGKALRIAGHGAAGTVYQTAGASDEAALIIDNNAQPSDSRTHLPPFLDPVIDELLHAAVIVTNRGALAITASDRIAALTIASATESLHLGVADTRLTVTGMLFPGDPPRPHGVRVNATHYPRLGIYSATDWNGYSPIPPNVSGDGDIWLRAPVGSLFQIR